MSKNKKDKSNSHDKPRKVFFKNYDLTDEDEDGPGSGFYSHMDEYESVEDFRKKKSKRKARVNLLKIILKNALSTS